ncbi:hypothetical protein GCM10009743_65430 [Kribbella swartbergensis]
MVVVGGGFVVAFSFGLFVVVKEVRQWIAGHPVPLRMKLLELGAVVVGLVILGLVDARLGWTILAGLMGGLLSANVWGTRIARANREALDKALSVRETSAVKSRPTTSAMRTEPLTTILRTNLLLERRRAIAWMIASMVAIAGVAVELPPAPAITAFMLGVAAFVWVLRRLVATWLAFRNLTNPPNPPHRAYVVLLSDRGALRPLLAMWSSPPVLRDGRLPNAEQVYRCDEEQDDLVSFAGSRVVHEAWVSTGRRPRSKPRWVVADAGVALPHRRAVFGRWHVGNLLAGERPGEARPLTLPPPHRGEEPRVHHSDLPGKFLTALAGRVACLAAYGLIVHWLI